MYFLKAEKNEETVKDTDIFSSFLKNIIVMYDYKYELVNRKNAFLVGW